MIIHVAAYISAITIAFFTGAVTLGRWRPRFSWPSAWRLWGPGDTGPEPSWEPVWEEPVTALVTDARPSRRRRRRDGAEAEADTFIGQLTDPGMDVEYHTSPGLPSTEITTIDDVREWSAKMTAWIQSWRDEDEAVPALPPGD